VRVDEEVVARAIAALRAGDVVVLPTDTVYGLAATADTVDGRDALYSLKGRDLRQPTALVASSLDALVQRLPELQGGLRDAVAALLPGPYTLVVPNPARRFAWLCGDDPSAIGIRVPALTGSAADVVRAVGAVAATSANLPGGPEARSVEQVPAALRAGSTVVVEGGELPGVPSTVLDLTGGKPRVLRVGAGDIATAIAALRHG
jgi:L-threonylcarbamoyladenylate synthase